ncbi:MAG: amidohydrolase [Planctomycetaceae bacterium]|nr:amidohydrolase [Planctomycetaceae bacterium]
MFAQDNKREAGWIDAHSHIWTPDTDAYPLVKPSLKAGMQPASFTAQELLDLVRPHGVQRVVLIQHNVFHADDNRYIVDAIRKHPGVFSGVAIVDNKKPHPVKKMKQLKQAGVRGFRIRPENMQDDNWLKDPGMQAMWKCAADENLAMCPLIDAKFLPSVDAMAKQFPETRVVVDHFARTGISGTVEVRDVANLCRLARRKNAFVKVSAFYALGKKKPPYHDLLPMIRRVIDAYGVDRLMWASDCPYQLTGTNTYGASIGLIKDGMPELSATDRAALLRGTAERVFFAKDA